MDCIVFNAISIDKNTHDCEICNRTFRTKHKLKIHSKSHLPKEQMKCDSCDMTFPNKHQLKCHQKTHLPPKPAKTDLEKNKSKTCHICQKTYSSHFSMKNHIKLVHLKQWDYKCDICGKLCCKEGDLKRHIQTGLLKHCGMLSRGTQIDIFLWQKNAHNASGRHF